MERTSLLLTLSLASILTVSLLSAVPNQAFAQQIDFEYRCYNTVGTVIPDVPSQKLIVEDQFGTEDYNIIEAVEFCNPALKAPEGNFGASPEGSLPHLRCWSIDDADNNPLNIRVTLKDQFSDDEIEHTILKAVEFCHTTTKGPGSLTLGAGTVAYDETANNHDPLHIANWVCYDITNKNIPDQPIRRLKDEFTITGADSFTPDGVQIGEALLLCTPATKTYFGQSFPPGKLGIPPPAGTVITLEEHLKCYDIVKEGLVNLNLPNGPPTDEGLVDVTNFPAETIPLLDQFSDASSDINRLDKICLDVEKKTAIAGTLIPLESIAILLAGAHMSTAWILPALVASAGVGYGIELARKYQKVTK